MREFKMVKVTFMAPADLVANARKYAFEEDRDLSSICRIALSKMLKQRAEKVAPRGRPKISSRTTPVKVL